MNNKRIKHGLSRTIFYSKWRGIVSRCKYKYMSGYSRYGGKNIGVCKEWLKFENFMNDMYKSYLIHLKKYGPENTTIDRIDSNGNYCPENCRWATIEQQANNRSSNHIVEYNGKKYTIYQLAKKFGIKRDTLQGRIHRYKWPVEKAVSIGIGEKRLGIVPVSVSCPTRK